jgi:hypothetical protein
LTGIAPVKQRSSAHNRQVRKFAAILMLVIFASLNAIDGICCPDGCTHEEEASSTTSLSQSGDGICVLTRHSRKR